MKVVAFLPVKSTSSRICNKNTKYLNGKPLFLYTLQKLCECDFIDDVYLDSDSDDILNYADYLSYKKLKRDEQYSTNKTDGNKLLEQEIEKVDADIYIQILCTSPFIKKETIKKAIDILKENIQYDSVVLVNNSKQYTWKNNIPQYDIDNIPNSIDLDTNTIECMALYVIRKDTFLKNRRRIGDNPYLLQCEPIESIDINYPEEFKLADIICKGLRQEQFNRLNLIKNYFNSSNINDVLIQMGYNNQLIDHLKCNFKNTKIIGFANTLKLKKLDTINNTNNIYNALLSYENVKYGDIIIVENECSEYAYFGNLNANLAIRCGCIGAIINGNVRDKNEIKNLNFPLWCKDYTPLDVYGHAELEYYNKPIHINNVTVYPEDIIFCDEIGCVIIPQKILTECINKTIIKIKQEFNVLMDILDNVPELDIVSNNGNF